MLMPAFASYISRLGLFVYRLLLRIECSDFICVFSFFNSFIPDSSHPAVFVHCMFSWGDGRCPVPLHTYTWAGLRPHTFICFHGRRSFLICCYSFLQNTAFDCISNLAQKFI